MLAAPVIRLGPGVLEAVRRHARREYPRECCGALVGRAAARAGGERLVVRALPLENAEREAPARGYLIPAAVVRRAERDAALEGLELVGFYHSHPGGGAEPSGVDREKAWPWYNYLIVAVGDGEPGDVRVWRLAEDRSRFDAVAIVVEDEERAPRIHGAKRGRSRR
ncbi:MAG TPA: M67 family metallopeptidase [Longimicrobiales bacterium]